MKIGLDEGWFGVNVVLQLVRMVKPKYWIETHDEPHVLTGLPNLILRRVGWTVEQALEKERELNGGEDLERLESVNLGNGESFVLA